jgi:hypothetical protein
MARFGIDPDMVEAGWERADRFLDQHRSTVELLEQVATQGSDGLQTLAITETEVPSGIEDDFPVPGARRWMIPRLATGGAFVIPTTLVKVLEANNRRLGGMIVNNSDAVVTLFLTSAETAAAQQGIGQIVLPPKGGKWDFLLGSLLWCGSICAKAAEGEKTISVVEV